MAVTASRFQYKFAAVYILYAVCIQTSVSIFVARAMMLYATNNIIDKDRYNQRALCFSAHRE